MNLSQLTAEQLLPGTVLHMGGLLELESNSLSVFLSDRDWLKNNWCFTAKEALLVVLRRSI